MRVYHGSSLEVQNPLTSLSKRSLDFGCGFYVTTFKSQAESWALRKAIRSNALAIVNIYELDEELSEYRKKEFLENNEEWVEFVCSCRRGGSEYQKYDLIIGGVANDKVYRVVDMYFRGIWDMERTLSEMSFYEHNDQICLINQELVDKHLTFIESYEVQDNG